MSDWLTMLRKVVSEFRSNPRLRYGVLLIVLVLLVDAGLRWSDYIGRQEQALAKISADLASLKAGTRDEAALGRSLAQARNAGEALNARLWTVSSEAVGQARMKDWLTDIVKHAIADQYAITLGVSRELGQSEAIAGNAVAASVAPNESPLREFRANVSFRLTPRALEGVLAELEGGEPFSAVEALVVKGQERRVELTVRVLMRIQPKGEHAAI